MKGAVERRHLGVGIESCKGEHFRSCWDGELNATDAFLGDCGRQDDWGLEGGKGLRVDWRLHPVCFECIILFLPQAQSSFSGMTTIGCKDLGCTARHMSEFATYVCSA